MRLAICAALFVAVLALLPAAPAAAATSCRSADLRYPFRAGGPKTFGVFKLRVTNGTCRQAHRVARTWMAENAAQTYRLRGRKAARTIRFDYRVPNG
jgi:hypothetical protein